MHFVRSFCIEMTAEKVWLRFEKKKKDGTVWKLRLQDLPAERIDEAVELRLKYFVRDETVHKATGLAKNPEPDEVYRQYLLKLMHDPMTRTVICCEDKGDAVGDIIGTSTVSLVTQDMNWDEPLEAVKEFGSKELNKMVEVFYAVSQMYQPMKALDVDLYLDDHNILVMPEYRRHGIAQEFLKNRRVMCAALNAPRTGGWMTGYGTQIAAARDGWETVFEVKYDELARNHGLVFEDAPPTMKYMVALPLKE